MDYYVGQKVSLLHDTGTGRITTVVDKQHVEVDLGDDFPIELHVSEIVPADPAEENFMQTIAAPKEKPAPAAYGPGMLQISLAVVPTQDDRYELILVNPENHDVVFTCFARQRRKYRGLAAGRLAAGERQLLAQPTTPDLHGTHSFYFQALNYKPGTANPEALRILELNWSKNKLEEEEPFLLPMIDRKGWVFNLEKSSEQATRDVLTQKESEFIRVKTEEKPTGGEHEIDLHIEQLVENPHELSTAEMLRAQLEAFEKALSDALVADVDRLIIIHGIGQGRLRGEVRARLKQHARVKRFEQADPRQYGNGATVAILA